MAINFYKSGGRLKMEEFRLSEEKVAEKVTNMPNIEVRISTSNDGKWVIHKTIITDIKPKTFYEKVLASE